MLCLTSSPFARRLQARLSFHIRKPSKRSRFSLAAAGAYLVGKVGFALPTAPWVTATPLKELPTSPNSRTSRQLICAGARCTQHSPSGAIQPHIRMQNYSSASRWLQPNERGI